MTTYANLPGLIAQCQSLPLASLAPRRSLHLPAWQEDWDANLSMLQGFTAHSALNPNANDLPANAQQATGMQCKGAAQTASHVLRLAIDRGVPAHLLRPMYVEVVSVWRAYAALALLAGDADPAPSGPVLRTETSDYAFALQLLALAVLLDEEAQIPAIVEELLHHRTDRLLDYLSAAATDLQEASDACFHPLPFDGLSPFLDQYGEILPDPLLPYLEQHYSQFFALPPVQQKQPARLTSAQDWWAWEVGALVALYGLEDSALRHNAHYPADLVDYAMGLRD